MKVLLIDPAKGFYAEEGAGKVIKQTPNIGLAYLGTVLEDVGHQVTILDLPVSKRSLLDVLKDVDPQVVGLSAMTFNIKDAYHCAETVKRYNPNIKVVVGGPHPTACAQEVLDECKDIDVVVRGEGELTFPLLLGCKPHPRIVEGKRVENLDKLPFPHWSLFDYEKSYSKAYSSRFDDMRHIYPIITSRGCPFNCVYCYSHYLGQGVRFRSAENVMDELLNDYLKYDARYFYFADSNFNLKPKRTERICKEILSHDEHTDISWTAQTNIHTASKSIFKLMRKAGCELIFFGIESGNEKVQQLIHKNLTKAMIRKAVNNAREAGLEVRASFIVGLPYDTKATMMETLEFAKSLRLNAAVFHILDIYPETELERMLAKDQGGMRLVDDRVSRGSVMVEVNDLDRQAILGFAQHGNLIVYPDMEDTIKRYMTELKYYREAYPRVFKAYWQRVAPHIKRWLDHL